MDVRLHHQSEMSTKGDGFMENDRDFPTHEGRGTEVVAFKPRFWHFEKGNLRAIPRAWNILCFEAAPSLNISPIPFK